MNIFVTIDKNYLNPLAVLLKSLNRIYPKKEIEIYVVHSTLEQMDFYWLQSKIQTNLHLHSVLLPKQLFADAPHFKRLSKASYYRLFAPLYLPKDMDRILYLDPDTLILRDFSDFYHADFGGKLWIGASHLTKPVNRLNTERLQIPKEYLYINSGVLLLNLPKIRASFQPKTIFEFMQQHEKQLLLADQDVLNALYYSRIQPCDATLYNLDERTYRRLQKNIGRDRARAYLENNTCILHYDGKQKPWNKSYRGELDVYYPNGLPTFT